jgi:hypothetical protein
MNLTLNLLTRYTIDRPLAGAICYALHLLTPHPSSCLFLQVGSSEDLDRFSFNRWRKTEKGKILLAGDTPANVNTFPCIVYIVSKQLNPNFYQQITFLKVGV